MEFLVLKLMVGWFPTFAAVCALTTSSLIAACAIRFIVDRVNRRADTRYPATRPRSPLALARTHRDGSKMVVLHGMSWKEAVHSRLVVFETGNFADVEIIHDPVY